MTPPDPAAAVDPAVLVALTSRLGSRAAACAEALTLTWRTESRSRLEALRAAAAAGDAVAAGRCAHALKSGSAALGALRLAAVCERLERRLRAGEPVDLPEALAAVTAEVDAADAAFHSLQHG